MRKMLQAQATGGEAAARAQRGRKRRQTRMKRPGGCGPDPAPETRSLRHVWAWVGVGALLTAYCGALSPCPSF